MLLILAVILVVLAFGAWPTWNYHALGYYPSSLAVILLVILLVLLLSGRL